MKIKMDKSLIVFIIAIVALFFFMSSRSKAEGDKAKTERVKVDEPCGKKPGTTTRVLCEKSFCSVKPSEATGLSGTCMAAAKDGWRAKAEKKDKK